MTLFDNPTTVDPHPLGGQMRRYHFPNGYAASVVRTDFSYGGPEGFYELAVMRDGAIVYDTPITDDVLGWLTTEKVEALLAQIRDLEAPK